MLQESSEQRIEFLHNTLKEFLAAERFVNIGNFQMLANHADEASWQPVILFAVALPRDGSTFGTELIKTILKATPKVAPTKARAKADRLEAAAVRAKQFFFLRCCTNAYQINDSSISQASAQLLKQLVPPQNMTDATVLAACGEAIVPYLKNRRGLKAAERAACVRTLGLIGDPRATDFLKEYLNDSTLTVVQEIANLVDDWSQIAFIKQEVEIFGTIRCQFLWKLRNVNPLFKLTNCKDLNLSETPVRDISALVNLTNLTTLDLSGTPVRDISALAHLTNLTTLDLSRTPVRDISALAHLTNLTRLNLFIRTQVRDISALAHLTNLKTLYLSATQVRDISALAHLTNLKTLYLSATQVSDISALAHLTNLTTLNLSRTPVSDISALAHLTNLTTLNLSGRQVSDISALAHLTNLTTLNLSGTPVSDISALVNLTNLTTLNLSGRQVSDISALAHLTNLKTLNLSRTQVSDISALAHLTNLKTLSLLGTQVSDISALADLNLTIYR